MHQLPQHPPRANIDVHLRCTIDKHLNTMKSAIAALALGALGAEAFVTPNAVVGRVATRSARQVHTSFTIVRVPRALYRLMLS